MSFRAAMVPYDRLHAVMRPKRPGGLAVRPSYDERRFAQRRSSTLPAYIFSDRMQSAVNCLVRDMSSTGAQIELVVDQYSTVKSTDELPQTFSLFIYRGEALIECQSAWREQRRMGVRFIGSMRHVPKRPQSRFAVKR